MNLLAGQRVELDERLLALGKVGAVQLADLRQDVHLRKI